MKVSMTREEAIEELERLLSHWDELENGKRSFRWYSKTALEVALIALRPISREQVEKVWRGEWNYSHTTEIDRFAVVKCSKCGHEAFGIALYVTQGNFCPVCGAAQTDEAVDMVMERLEALYDTSN